MEEAEIGNTLHDLRSLSMIPLLFQSNNNYIYVVKFVKQKIAKPNLA